MTDFQIITWLLKSDCMYRSFISEIILLDPFQPSAVFHIDLSHLICITNQMASFYMKYNTGLNRLIYLPENCRNKLTIFAMKN